MECATFISSIAWIPPGYAAKVPLQIQLTQEQINEMKADPQVLQQQRKEKEGEGQRQTEQMEDQDDDLPVFGQNLLELMGSGGSYPMAIEDMSDDEKEDYYIKDTDALIVAGKIQKEHASLEVYIYEQQTSSLFVHHQIMLTAFPLDIAHLRVSLGSIGSAEPTKGNYAIVASFLPQIEIWNLDLVEAIEPQAILGGQLPQNSNKRKVKKFTNQSKKYREGSHTDSVITLSLNPSNLGVLASGSADTSVKIWDLSKLRNIHTASHHKAPLKKISWSPTDPTVIFTAAQDRTISILDSRYPNDILTHALPEGHTLECASWNINNPAQIMYGTAQGLICIVDVRVVGKIMQQTKAHKGTVNDIQIGRKGLAFTCSQDQTVRVWNMNSLAEPIAAKNPKCGNLFCLDLLDQDSGPVITAGNSKGQLFVWDVTQNQAVNHHWQSN